MFFVLSLDFVTIFSTMMLISGQCR